MQATADKVVSIDYTLKDAAGSVVDSSEGQGPLAYLHGAGNIIPGLERELEGKSAGTDFAVTVAAADAYGERDDSLVQPVPMSQFPPGSNPKVGQQFHAQTPAGMRTVTVVQVDPETVTIDANHPLAGQLLHFTGKVVDVRDATQEELDHGHVHGAGGHAH